MERVRIAEYDLYLRVSRISMCERKPELSQIQKALQLAEEDAIDKILLTSADHPCCYSRKKRLEGFGRAFVRGAVADGPSRDCGPL
jgi:hypothetical protein